MIFLAAGFVFAEEIMLASAYVTTQDGDLYNLDGEGLPIINYIDLDDDQGTITLYYYIDYEPMSETVEYEESSDEYGSTVQFAFYTEDLGFVKLNIFVDGELQLNGLWTRLASCRIDNDYGIYIYNMVAAAESFQYEDEEIENFLGFIEDFKSEY